MYEILIQLIKYISLDKCSECLCNFVNFVFIPDVILVY